MKFKGLAHIALFTEDIDVSKEFYMSYLGFEVLYETTIQRPNDDFLKISMIQLNNLVIELLQPKNTQRIRKGDGCFEHIAIEVEDLNSIVALFKEKGIVFDTEEPRKIDQLFNGIQMIFFRGPNGERIELFEYLN